MMRQIVVPEAIERAMRAGAALAISISGGKDSQAMLNALAAERRRRGWQGSLRAVHAHLGRAEWRQTLGHCRNLCARLDIDLMVVARPQGDLVQEIDDRVEKLGGTAPPWPSATARYCTSDQKRGQIDKVIRSSPWPASTQRYCTADQKRDQIIKVHREHTEVIVAAMGMRAQESTARAKKVATQTASRVTAKALKGLEPEDALLARRPGQRLGLEWLPIHEWSLEDVWGACGHSVEDLERRQELYRAGQFVEAFTGWLAHPAYVMGNERLSCSICILACKGDIVNGAAHNPEVYQHYVQIEQETGFSFRVGLSLGDLAEEVAAVAATAEVATAAWEEVAANAH
jgi:3'-phosphoadenosine 5'-phosphosulfate sulfotransferase (PAPS reductase)/FAD synthetase